MRSRTDWNCGLSCRCPAVISRDSDFCPCSVARWIFVVRPSPERPRPWSSCSVSIPPGGSRWRSLFTRAGRVLVGTADRRAHAHIPDDGAWFELLLDEALAADPAGRPLLPVRIDQTAELIGRPLIREPLGLPRSSAAATVNPKHLVGGGSRLAALRGSPCRAHVGTKRPRNKARCKMPGQVSRRAEADGNRTRLPEILGHLGFEDREGHQAPTRLLAGSVRADRTASYRDY
jgi:hypothetical protein